MIGVLDLFKIGIGPSSSHTVGPMIAARRFVDRLRAGSRLDTTARLTVELFGSLAWTGSGHGTDKALLLGLAGFEPATVDPDRIDLLIADMERSGAIVLGATHRIGFAASRDIAFNRKTLLDRHSNAMRFRAFDAAGLTLAEADYFSIGGGFITGDDDDHQAAAIQDPLPFTTAAELLAVAERENASIAEVQWINERAHRPEGELVAAIDAVLEAMHACIDRGLRAQGELPGGLRVARRAPGLLRSLEKAGANEAAHAVMDWIATYAIAVNEENAAGGRVVTAPTNGAAGIIPAVLRYFREFCPQYSRAGEREFLLTAAAIGKLIKLNASVSGAEVGCQGEVGSAAAMAAAALAAVLGGSPRQVENAAEIAMEHHLGMTCDPVGGLVQIPCIERNAFGANKAVAAASLALRGDGSHRVSLDEVVETMRQTGLEMNSKYKETSQGGLAVNVAEC
jgi:L-serine dehydratase